MRTSTVVLVVSVSLSVLLVFIGLFYFFNQVNDLVTRINLVVRGTSYNVIGDVVCVRGGPGVDKIILPNGSVAGRTVCFTPCSWNSSITEKYLYSKMSTDSAGRPVKIDVYEFTVVSKLCSIRGVEEKIGNKTINKNITSIELTIGLVTHIDGKELVIPYNINVSGTNT